VPDLWLPGVIAKPIPKSSTDPFIIPVGDVFHVAVSEGSSLQDYFWHRSGGIESTGYIRRDGTIEQYRPLNVECDAQGDGNSWVEGGKRYGFNSWETQGMGEGQWTAEQLASIMRIISWKHQHYGTPLRLAPAWNSPGFGYHRLHARWNKNGHSCPGPDRVVQFNKIIVPWMHQGADVTAGQQEVDDMPAYSEWSAKDKAALAADVADAVLNADRVNVPDTETDGYKKASGKTVRTVSSLARLMTRAASSERKLDQALALLKGLSAGK
jgi:hypothetical protein